jgi:mRNA-degrading endonuclease RelE of RelBE toxin-antitoxin system
VRLRFTQRFQEAYAKLSDEAAEQVQEALAFLASNPHHPGLQVKKMRGAEGIWEARASLSLRLTFQMEGDTILLRNVGAHDAALARP